MSMRSVFAKAGSESELEYGSVFVVGSESSRRSSRRLSEPRQCRTQATSRTGFSVRNRAPMPSVGMRRTTRVFGVVKGLDGGARVLRSGRRLWSESDDSKLRRVNDGEDWFKLMKNPGNGGLACKQSGWVQAGVKRVAALDINDSDECKTEVLKCNDNAVNVSEGMDKLFGIVYSRKRKRTGTTSCDFSSGDSNRRYGLRFVRRQRRKIDDCEGLVVLLPRPVLAVVGVGVVSDWFVVKFLYSVLSYMRRARLGLNKLSAFLCSEPIASVYASCGIQFLRDPLITCGSGMCKFFGAVDFIPLFSVDFSALPQWFMYMHYGMLLRFKTLQFVLVNNLIAVDRNDDMTDSEEDESKEHHVCIPPERELSACSTVMPVIDPSKCKNVVLEVPILDNRALHPSVRASKLAGRSAQCRNGLNSRGFRKTRSSLRRRRARNPPVVGVHRPTGSLVSDAIANRRSGIPHSSLAASRRSGRSSSATQIKGASCALVGSRQDIDSSCCSANILVIESDKCSREAGANILLEISSSREWLLVIKRDGLTRYTQKAEKIMRPCSCNRFTHAIMWNLDNGWKLEFSNRVDWFTFKDLYKECSDRNVLVPNVKNIPVPGVIEVLDYGKSNTATFCRPDSYISVKDDEVSRAMARRGANYDLDSEDEKWLEKFNDEDFTQDGLHQSIFVDAFELMVDAFEKAYYCHPDDLPDEKAAANLCPYGQREVEAVYNYWIKKRKQKGSVLVRVFQGQQAKRAPVIPKPFLRKRRSFKRQPSQLGRGKPPSVLRAMVAEQDALEEKNVMLKVKEANASADRSVELAILKRKRAQFLMNNADLAAYRAVMALQIAEAARVAETPDATTSCFLD